MGNTKGQNPREGKTSDGDKKEFSSPNTVTRQGLSDGWRGSKGVGDVEDRLMGILSSMTSQMHLFLVILYANLVRTRVTLGIARSEYHIRCNKEPKKKKKRKKASTCD